MELSGIERKVDLIIKMPNSKELFIFKTIQDEGIIIEVYSEILNLNYKGR